MIIDINSLEYKKIEQLLNEIGFNNEECLNIVTRYKDRHKYNLSKIYNNIYELYISLINYGVNNSDIKTVIERFYPIFSTVPKDFSTKLSNFEKRGYKKDELIKMITFAPSIISMDEEVINSRFRFFEKIGYSYDEIISISKKAPVILTHSEEYIINKFEEFKLLGFTYEEIKKIVGKFPNLITFSLKTLSDKINGLIDLGFDQNRVIEIIKSHPQIIGFTIDSLKEKIEEYIEMGFTKEETIKLLSETKGLFSISSGYVKNRIEDIMKCGYSKEDALKIIKGYAGISTISRENTIEKLEFYNSIGLHNLAIVSPKQLMQSVKLSHARREFYMSSGIVINMENYRKLFLGEKQFIKMYNKTNNELISEYPRDEKKL